MGCKQRKPEGGFVCKSGCSPKIGGWSFSWVPAHRYGQTQVSILTHLAWDQKSVCLSGKWCLKSGSHSVVCPLLRNARPPNGATVAICTNSIYLSFLLSIYLSVYLSIHLFLWFFSIDRSFHRSIVLSIGYRSIYLRDLRVPSQIRVNVSVFLGVNQPQIGEIGGI